MEKHDYEGEGEKGNIWGRNEGNERRPITLKVKDSNKCGHGQNVDVFDYFRICGYIGHGKLIVWSG